jgi:hypothetical protein
MGAWCAETTHSFVRHQISCERSASFPRRFAPINRWMLPQNEPVLRVKPETVLHLPGLEVRPLGGQTSPARTQSLPRPLQENSVDRRLGDVTGVADLTDRQTCIEEQLERLACRRYSAGISARTLTLFNAMFVIFLSPRVNFRVFFVNLSGRNITQRATGPSARGHTTAERTR